MKRFSEKQIGLLSSAELRSARGRLLYWFLFFLLVLMVIITVFPALWMILTAFKTTQEIYTSTEILPENFTLVLAVNQIVEAWKMLRLGRSMLNTLGVSAVNAVVAILIPGMAGYAISKRKSRGIGVIFGMVVWTMMMPATVQLVPRYISFISFPLVVDDGMRSVTNVNVLNTYLPLWLGAAANSFNLILFKNAFDAVPNTLLDAARIDGCNEFRIFFLLMLPLCKATVFFVSVGTLSVAWSDYLNPYLILSEADLLTTPAKLFTLQGLPGIPTNVYMMGLVFACIPPALIYIFFQRRMTGGVMMGAVKG
ncbi:MAG: carbohydrate ABC transporter permease [Eubacteriales bacterium]|nr:carbohydrate ABC transporter permease [Eubacteriales bacterium]